MTLRSMPASVSITNAKPPASSTGVVYPARYGYGASTLSFIHWQIPTVRGSNGVGDPPPWSVAS
eukprot:13617913-Alexandrium_andersonii.AAC.1